MGAPQPRTFLQRLADGADFVSDSVAGEGGGVRGCEDTEPLLLRDNEEIYVCVGRGHVGYEGVGQYGDAVGDEGREDVLEGGDDGRWEQSAGFCGGVS